MKIKKPTEKTVSSQTVHQLIQDFSLKDLRIPFSGKIKGNSMLPWIKPLDRIIIEPLHEPIDLGSIVLIFNPEKSRFIAHRIIKIKKLQVVTKGDNCLHPDPIADINQISGRVTGILRGDKTVTWGFGKEKILIAVLSRFNILQICFRIFRKIAGIKRSA